MPFLDAHELIAFALEQAYEENLMKRWIACYQPEMDFDEFKQKIGFVKESDKQEISTESIDDVLKGLGNKFG